MADSVAKLTNSGTVSAHFVTDSRHRVGQPEDRLGRTEYKLDFASGYILAKLDFASRYILYQLGTPALPPVPALLAGDLPRLS